MRVRHKINLKKNLAHGHMPSLIFDIEQMSVLFPKHKDLRKNKNRVKNTISVLYSMTFIKFAPKKSKITRKMLIGCYYGTH